MSYCRVARLYRMIEMCSIGGALQAARIGQLPCLAAHSSLQRALIVGEGNGSFLISFARAFPATHITVVDVSAAMVQVAKARLEKTGLASARIEFLVADLRALSLPEQSYDLIVTHFFFDNFIQSDVEGMIAALVCASRSGANWLLADFCIPPHGWRSWRAKLWLRALYVFFGYTASVPTRVLPETEALLSATCFKPMDRKTFCGAMLYSACYTRA